MYIHLIHYRITALDRLDEHAQKILMKIVRGCPYGDAFSVYLFRRLVSCRYRLDKILLDYLWEDFRKTCLPF